MEEMTERSGKGPNPGLVFLLGAAVGAAAGILLAPKSGAETRAMLAAKAREARDKASEAVEMVREKVEGLRARPDGPGCADET